MDSLSAAEKKRKAAERKAYANSRGAKRGAIGGKHDFIFKQDTPILDPEAPNEGLYVLVQTGTCRRAVLTLIYGNKPAQPTVPCCDICCPELLDQTRPGKPLAVPRQSSVKRGEVNRDLQLVLHNWRISIKKRDFPGALYSAAAIMRDETIALLASVGPLGSQAHLAKVLAGQWTWWDKYGAELYTCLAAQVIPPLKELLKKPRVKRGAGGEPEESSATKRRRGNELSVSDALTTQRLASSSLPPFSRSPQSTKVPMSFFWRKPPASIESPASMNFNAVLVTLELAKSAATGIGIPGVESAVNAVAELASMVSRMNANEKELPKLIKTLNNFIEIDISGCRTDLAQRLYSLASKLSPMVERCNILLKKPRFKRFVSSKKHEKEIQEMKHLIASHIQEFTVSR
ncbi:hypothetical protein GGX14DRAFT_693065 [Mycena pura]|uniref:Uncharacterized protein n=1 Tax=Mycena pura TaxID=153505 RepID=A0AAD7E3P8_9AGAR|nr:hypothetical protein GGX14DRAFT_693065 [Mycena pura]